MTHLDNDDNKKEDEGVGFYTLGFAVSAILGAIKTKSIVEAIIFASIFNWLYAFYIIASYFNINLF